MRSAHPIAPTRGLFRPIARSRSSNSAAPKRKFIPSFSVSFSMHRFTGSFQSQRRRRTIFLDDYFFVCLVALGPLQGSGSFRINTGHDMWIFLLGPFLSLLPERWRKALPFCQSVHWRSAAVLSGLAESVIALGGLMYWYSYSVTTWVSRGLDN